VGLVDEVRNVLLSPQFLTTIQAQSLFVVGHFIHNLDKHGNAYHGRRLMKRNIPQRFRQCEKETSMVMAYENIVAEWGRLLQLGITKHLNGEINRCFFGALGQDNFLQRHRGIEPNPSFLAVGERRFQDPGESRCCYETLGCDGRRLAVWEVTWPQ
jgi:hypothetical protein